ncbi:MAG: 6-chlorohydroxyquinol-1,2-dioxygenase, partial [Mesorhizobium sp.]
PAHLHYIVEAAGFEALTTHIFDPDDPYIDSDAVFGVKKSLLAEFRKIEDAEAAARVEVAAPFYDVEFDFVLSHKGGN